MIDNEKKFIRLINKFPDLASFELVNELYNNQLYSLPMFREKFKVDYKAMLFILNYHGIKTRSISESGLLISSKKIKKTCLEKYGVSNVSEVQFVKDKREKTLMENYGVDNIFKSDEFKQKLNGYILNKYNVSLKEFRSRKSKEIWSLKNEEEKQEWLQKSIFSRKFLENSSGSKKEEYIGEILSKLNIRFQKQYLIFGNNKNNFFDYYLLDYNTILEFNGNYWHCNPIKYKKYQVVKMHGKLYLCKDIWKKDERKNSLVYKEGKDLIIVWESEIDLKTDNEIAELIIFKLKELKKNVS